MDTSVGPSCPACNAAMKWHADRQIEIGLTRRRFDIFRCDTCGRFGWANLEASNMRSHASRAKTTEAHAVN
jgi:uncharacterized protein with PIN domain